MRRRVQRWVLLACMMPTPGWADPGESISQAKTQLQANQPDHAEDTLLEALATDPKGGRTRLLIEQEPALAPLLSRPRLKARLERTPQLSVLEQARVLQELGKDEEAQAKAVEALRPKPLSGVCAVIRKRFPEKGSSPPGAELAKALSRCPKELKVR